MTGGKVRFQAIDPSLVNQKPAKVKKAKTLKPIRSTRRKTVEDFQYERTLGSDLFEAFQSKEREVSITFSLLTLDMVKLSTDGRYGFKHIVNEEEHWILYHYFTPIKWDDGLDTQAILVKDKDYETFIFTCGKNGCKRAIDTMVCKIVSLVRDYYAKEDNKVLIDNTKSILETMKEISHEYQTKSQGQVESECTLPTESEDGRTEETLDNVKETQEEERKEDVSKVDQKPKVVRSTGSFFRKVS